MSADRFGHMFDAFVALREISEHGGDLRAWAGDLAELCGEQENLKHAWPDTEATRRAGDEGAR